MKRTATLILLVVGIAVPLWLVAGRTGRAKPAATTRADDESGNTEVATRVSDQRRPQVLLVPVPTAAPSPEAPAAEAAPRTPEQVATDLEEAFRTDKPADADAVRMESGIANGFQTDAPRARRCERSTATAPAAGSRSISTTTAPTGGWWATSSSCSPTPASTPRSWGSRSRAAPSGPTARSTPSSTSIARRLKTDVSLGGVRPLLTRTRQPRSGQAWRRRIPLARAP